MPKNKAPSQMQLVIHGKCSGRLKKIVTQATSFYLSLLMPRHIVECLTIHIHMKTRRGMKGDEGTCLVTDCDGRNIPREFELELNRDNNTKTTLYNLAHELTHVKQFAMGELNENQSKWYGKHYDTEKINYWDLPWEIDAYGRERGLFIRFVDKYDLNGIDEEPLCV